MWSVLALGATESILNRIVDLDQITRIKLNQLQGQSLRIVIQTPNVSIDVFLDQDKIRLEPTALGHSTQTSIFEQRPFDPQFVVNTVQATLQVDDLVQLLKLLLNPQDELGNIPLQGDYHLLFSLKQIFSQIDVDLAAHLSPWIGATSAHEIGKLQYLPKQFMKAAKSAEFMLIDSLKEDSQLFAARWQMEDLQQHTRQLNQDIDRVDARIQQLQQHIVTSKQD
ncbi:hypothetical protein F4V57_06635 [Acinetobacter qingfengensis]|uniref:Ubiquinone biosynthesis accessory factor UbiJ n=1 Tax=Acinetobacter qingfengensis TaxID=1262585 RepID=A0A1E7REC9_9GAMM|nr:hypothetical protein [Acinetobacter qingfengensis]KAA8733933.1 hypothetical protein F4V57_06635 [Acinetobacter qingfengensis]OEY97515.1 hypothetical protein BJI46_09500 [Acinetobacter qingfengensis]